MQLTKFGHACVRISKDGSSIVIDPGQMTPEPGAWDGVEAVLVTHEHFDHLDPDRLARFVVDHPDVRVLTTAGAALALDGVGVNAEVLHDGERIEVGAFRITGVGSKHHRSHPDAGPVDNVGFLVDDVVLHPGDSLPETDAPVVLVAADAPWLTVPELLGYLRRIRPRRTLAVHDGLLNDWGLRVVDSVLQFEAEHSGTEVRRLHVEESVQL